MLSIAEGGCPQNPSLQTSAQFNVGCAYNQGFGVWQSYSEAVRWWTQAAEAEGCSSGTVLAQNILGMHYSREESQDLRKVSLLAGECDWVEWVQCERYVCYEVQFVCETCIVQGTRSIQITCLC